MQAVSGFPVHTELFDLHAEAAMGHIELARWADIVVVAPASADFMARLANGNADDLLTTLCLATPATIAIAPAMNQAMWKHTVTQANLQALQQKHVHIFGPAEGNQACGDVGPGRMLEPVEIIEKLNTIFSTGSLAGKQVVITAGPTHEAIDPIRFLTNGSSGKMGYALAEAAREAGAQVTLISGPVQLPKPSHVDVVPVTTALEMHAAVMRKMAECDIFLAVAAVGDYRSQEIAPQKLHKDAETMQLSLVRNPDIVSDVAKLANPPFIVGFAAETESVIEQAKTKRQRKKMDMIIANQISADQPMGSDENTVTVISETSQQSLPAAHKRKVAREIIAMIASELKKRTL